MAEVVHVGCADLPPRVGWDRYFSRLSFVETSVLTRKPPRPSVLAKWRAAAPGAGAFSVVAPAITERPLGVTGGVDPLAEACRTLDASAVLFRSPATFSPSAANRDLLRRFFAEVAPAETFGAAARVWQPGGLWEVVPALKLAGELGVVLATDPFLKDPTRDPPDFFATLDATDVYLRVSGLGRGARRLSTAQLDELVEITEAYERTWVVFATVEPMADATRFAKAIGAAMRAGGADLEDEAGDADESE